MSLLEVIAVTMVYDLAMVWEDFNAQWNRRTNKTCDSGRLKKTCVPRSLAQTIHCSSVLDCVG